VGLLVVFYKYQWKHQQIPMLMHDERQNKISLLKYEVCALLMIQFESKQFGFVQTVQLWFNNHY